MHTEDRIQNTELKIIEVLYRHWKDEDKNEGFDAASHKVTDILSEANLSENNAMPSIRNLRDFDFVELKDSTIKLLPSGIKYGKGQFDGQPQ